MRLAISTTETLTDLKTDLVVANNNNNSDDFGEGYRSVNEDQQSSSLTMGTILTYSGVVPGAGVLGFG